MRPRRLSGASGRPLNFTVRRLALMALLSSLTLGLVAALVMTGASHLTKATIVNGRIVARDGHLTSMDEQRILRDGAAWAKRLVA